MSYLHHHPFWLRISNDFDNNNFVDIDIRLVSSTEIEITGWIFYLKQLKLNGLNMVAGFPTPTDLTKPTVNSTDNIGPGPNAETGAPGLDSWFFNYEFSPTEKPTFMQSIPNSKSVRLYSAENWIDTRFGILRGPYMVSKSSVRIFKDSQVKFWYRGLGGQDAFDIYAYLLNIGTGETIQLINQYGIDDTGETPWTESVMTINKDGIYRFIFVNGSWDFTGGKLTGASMYVASVRVVRE